jgi:cell fate regulator YaaT (PSP1 superfamily)
MVRVPVFVTYGRMRLTGYFRHQLPDYHGGDKVVVQSDRGVEMGEITISHCAVCPAGSGCSKPKNTDRRSGENSPVGRVLRPAGPEDLQEYERLAKQDREVRDAVRARVAARGMPMKVVDAERLLGGDRIVVYFASENRVDFRELVKELAREFQTRIEMRQIGARDEAKLLGEGYGRCGEPLCCQTFLKDLKNVPMKMAKTQKATLDPNKVSGRCGRLMCCLRYEDDTYEDLRKRLPAKGARVRTAGGAGTVIDTQILTQLVLIDMDGKGRVAVGVEDLLTGDTADAKPATAVGGSGFAEAETGDSFDAVFDDSPPRDEGAPEPRAETEGAEPSRREPGRPNPAREPSDRRRPRDRRPNPDRPRPDRAGPDRPAGERPPRAARPPARPPAPEDAPADVEPGLDDDGEDDELRPPPTGSFGPSAAAGAWVEPAAPESIKPEPESAAPESVASEPQPPSEPSAPPAAPPAAPPPPADDFGAGVPKE